MAREQDTAEVSAASCPQIGSDVVRVIRKSDHSVLTPSRLRAFLNSIEKPSGIEGCWVWTGAVNAGGYPSGNNTGAIPMHRLSYMWMVGPIPPGLELDHLCRNRACVNPHHLEPVTSSENKRRARHPDRPWSVRRYCRRGHVLDAFNARSWSNGKGQREIRCFTCHGGKAAHGA
jgi:hypothetical protein